MKGKEAVVVGVAFDVRCPTTCKSGGEVIDLFVARSWFHLEACSASGHRSNTGGPVALRLMEAAREGC